METMILVSNEQIRMYERATKILETVQITGYEEVDDTLTWLTLEYEHGGTLIRLGCMVCMEEMAEQMKA